MKIGFDSVYIHHSVNGKCLNPKTCKKGDLCIFCEKRGFFLGNILVVNLEHKLIQAPPFYRRNIGTEGWQPVDSLYLLATEYSAIKFAKEMAENPDKNFNAGQTIWNRTTRTPRVEACAMWHVNEKKFTDKFEQYQMPTDKPHDLLEFIRFMEARLWECKALFDIASGSFREPLPDSDWFTECMKKRNIRNPDWLDGAKWYCDQWLPNKLVEITMDQSTCPGDMIKKRLIFVDQINEARPATASKVLENQQHLEEELRTRMAKSIKGKKESSKRIKHRLRKGLELPKSKEELAAEARTPIPAPPLRDRTGEGETVLDVPIVRSETTPPALEGGAEEEDESTDGEEEEDDADQGPDQASIMAEALRLLKLEEPNPMPEEVKFLQAKNLIDDFYKAEMEEMNVKKSKQGFFAVDQSALVSAAEIAIYRSNYVATLWPRLNAEILAYRRKTKEDEEEVEEGYVFAREHVVVV